jgi:hypothetical protein
VRILVDGGLEAFLNVADAVWSSERYWLCLICFIILTRAQDVLEL